MRLPFVSRQYADLLRQELDRARDEIAHLREVNERLVGSALLARGFSSPYASPQPVEPPRPVGRMNAEKMIRELEAKDREAARKAREEHGRVATDAAPIAA